MVNIEDMSIESIEKHLARLKKREEFPKIFDDGSRRIEVSRIGNIFVSDKMHNRISFWNSLPLLDKAVALSQKIRGVNTTHI